MPLNEATPRVDATLVTATDAIPFAFPFTASDELSVYSLADGLLVLDTDYTVAIDTDGSGGTVTMVGQTIGDVITILRDTPISQQTDLRRSGKFFPQDVNAALDKATKIIQEFQERLVRTLTTDPSDNTSLELPAPSVRAGKLIRFDENGDLIISSELGLYRGEWVTGTAYNQFDFFKVTDGNGIATIYVVDVSHTSTSIVADLADSKIAVLIDGTSISAALTGAETAQTAAETAQTGAEAAQVAAEAVFDTFDDSYLGAKASDPTLDNDGDALADGALYFNTTVNELRVYDLGTTTWLSLDADSVNALLAGLSLADSSDVTETDTVLEGIGKLQAQGLAYGFISGGIVSNDGVTPDEIIDVTEVTCVSSDGTRVMNIAADSLNVTTNADWASGTAPTLTDASIHLWADYNSGTPRYIFDDATGSNIAGAKRRVASFLCDGTGDIIPFICHELAGGGYELAYLGGIQDYTISTTTSVILIPLSVPTGHRFRVFLGLRKVYSVGSSITYLRDVDRISNTSSMLRTFVQSTATQDHSFGSLLTDTSAQIYYQTQSSSSTGEVTNYGFIDERIS